jgi:hypothetical protein
MDGTLDGYLDPRSVPFAQNSAPNLDLLAADANHRTPSGPAL